MVDQLLDGDFPKDQGLLNDLADVINRHSVDNMLNTPDFIVAGYLYVALHNLHGFLTVRDRYFGINQPEDLTKTVE